MWLSVQALTVSAIKLDRKVVALHSSVIRLRAKGFKKQYLHSHCLSIFILLWKCATNCLSPGRSDLSEYLKVQVFAVAYMTWLNRADHWSRNSVGRGLCEMVVRIAVIVRGGGSKPFFWEDPFWAWGTTGALSHRGNFWRRFGTSAPNWLWATPRPTTPPKIGMSPIWS